MTVVFNENWASYGKILRLSDMYEIRVFSELVVSAVGVAGGIEGYLSKCLRC